MSCKDLESAYTGGPEVQQANGKHGHIGAVGALGGSKCTGTQRPTHKVEYLKILGNFRDVRRLKNIC